MDALSHIAWIARQLLPLPVLAASAWVFGEALLRRLRLAGSGVGGVALAAVLGLGLISQGMFLLGIAGLLYPLPVLTLLALGHLVCRRVWRDAFVALQGGFDPKALRLPAAFTLATLLPMLLLALYPATAFDATLYHLPYVQAFAKAGRLVFVPELRFPIFPQAIELQMLLGWFLGGETGAHWTQVLAWGCTAGLVAKWGEELGSRQAGRWAAALWLGSPIAVWLGSSAYIDVGFTAFVTAAFLAWERWRRRGQGAWLVLAGVFVGFAAASKYLGLFFCAALGVLTLVHAFRRGHSLRPAALLTAAAVATLCPWYLRIGINTGNPVFPFYASVFGASEWLSYHGQVEWRGEDMGAIQPDHGALGLVGQQLRRIGDSVGFLALVPWNMLFHRELVRHQSLLNPWYLVLIPLGLSFALRRGPPRRMLAIAGLFALFWLSTSRSLRYLLPALPLLDLSLAIGVERCLSGRWMRRIVNPQRIASLLALLFWATGPTYGIFRAVRNGPLPTTSFARSQYLERQLPGVRLIHHLNATRGADYTVYGLHAERLRYYAEGQFLGDWFGPHRFARVQPLLGDPDALYTRLAELGVSHLLIRRDCASATGADLQRSFRVAAKDNTFLLLETSDPPADVERDLPTPLQLPIFADGLESGNTAAWSLAEP